MASAAEKDDHANVTKPDRRFSISAKRPDNTDQRNFRSQYYEKVGFRGVDERKTLELLLDEDPINLIKLQNSGLSQMQSTKRMLSNQIEELKKLHNNPKPEVRTDFHNIKAEMLESFRAMQKENSVILSELTEMKELVKKIFHLVVQISYKVKL